MQQPLDLAHSRKKNLTRILSQLYPDWTQPKPYLNLKGPTWSLLNPHNIPSFSLYYISKVNPTESEPERQAATQTALARTEPENTHTEVLESVV